MSKILITGANGTLTPKIIEELSKETNFEIFASSRVVVENIKRISGVNYISNNDLFNSDLLKNIDIVLHAAFPCSEDIEVLKKGKDFFEALLHKCKENGVKNFINISSQDVYGTYRETVSLEATSTKPENEYAKAKLACESLGLNIASDFMNYTNIRLGSLIGIEYKKRIINRMIKFALQDKKIGVQHSNNVFNFLDVQDAAKGLVNFILNTNPNDWQECYNLGQISKTNENTLYIANCIKKICEEYNITIDVDVKSTDSTISRLLDSTNFYNVSNWQPKISLKESIRNIFDDIYAEFLSNGGIE